jgi:hypothetical protein
LGAAKTGSAFANVLCIVRNRFGELINWLGRNLLGGLSIAIIMSAGLDAVRASGPNLSSGPINLLAEGEGLIHCWHREVLR